MKHLLHRFKNPKRLILILVLLSVFAEVCYWLLSPRPAGFQTLLARYGFATPNRLQHEKSPYLLQHADNPVEWYAWGAAAFEKARLEKKPLFISIGYSTCHWCHRMETESFESPEVAEVLNREFVAIKVDREERPEVDHVYMTYVQESTGQGGWPLTVVAAPDGRPYFGATYMPKALLLETLPKLATAWQTDPEKVADFGRLIYETLLSQATLQAQTPPAGEPLFRRVFATLENNFDHHSGGFGGAPKFPPSLKVQWLLRVSRRTQDERPLLMAEWTLQRMAQGAIFDQVGGGFHRYATDAAWRTPHFEKMLTDNAVLAYTYLEAFQLTRRQIYRDVATLTLGYMEKNLRAPEGGFYTAQDADVGEEEGGYYRWKRAAIEQSLSPDEATAFFRVFDLENEILFMKEESNWADRDAQPVRSALQKLQAVRLKRQAPFTDEKALTSGNGLGIAAFAKAYQVLGDERYLRTAQEGAAFIKKELFKTGELLRFHRNGAAELGATLDDHACLIHGLLHLYEADFDPQWLQWAAVLQVQQNERFWDPSQGGYFFTPEDPAHLFVRPKRFYDDDKPNGMGLTVLNLLKLNGLTGSADYREKADATVKSVGWLLEKVPESLAQMLIALDFRTDQSREIALIESVGDPGGESRLMRRFLQESYLPNKVLAAGREGETQIPLLQHKTALHGKTTAYVCENQRCRLPTTDLKDLAGEVGKAKTYALQP